MDEIDAALDFRNVSIIANYIKAVEPVGHRSFHALRVVLYECHWKVHDA